MRTGSPKADPLTAYVLVDQLYWGQRDIWSVVAVVVVVVVVVVVDDDDDDAPAMYRVTSHLRGQDYLKPIR